MILDFIILFLSVLYKYLLVDTRKKLPTVYYLILLAIALLCMLKIFFSVESHRMPQPGYWPAKLLGVFLFVVLVTVISRDANFLLPFLLAVAFSYDNDHRFIKGFFTSSCICFAFHILLHLLGFLPDQVVITRMLGNGQIVRRASLGFEHPNNASLFFLPIFLGGYILINKKTEKLLFCFFTILSICGIYFTTRSRTGVFLILFFLLSFLINEQKLLNHRWIFKIFNSSFFLLSAVSIILAKSFGENANNWVNQMLSNRPYIWNQYLKLSINLIGASSGYNSFTAQNMYSVDNYYIFILVNYGLLPFLMVGYLTYNLMKDLFNAKRAKLYIAVTAFLIYGITETNTIIPSINFTLCFLYVEFMNRSYFSDKTPLDHLKTCQLKENHHASFGQRYRTDL
jgi:hypothetical protein